MLIFRNPLGSAYIELPKKLRSPMIINIQNSDNYCFAWCVLAYLHPAKDHSKRVSNYEPYTNELNVEGINFPSHLVDIEKFQLQNVALVSVNVYELSESNKISKVFISHNNPKGCNLLCYGYHYVLCKDISIYYRHSKYHKAYPC